MDAIAVFERREPNIDKAVLSKLIGKDTDPWRVVDCRSPCQPFLTSGSSRRNLQSLKWAICGRNAWSTTQICIRRMGTVSRVTAAPTTTECRCNMVASCCLLAVSMSGSSARPTCSLTSPVWPRGAAGSVRLWGYIISIGSLWSRIAPNEESWRCLHAAGLCSLAFIWPYGML